MSEEKKEVTPTEKVKNALAKATKPNTLLGLKSSDILQVFEGIKIQIMNALPKHLTPERMIQVATTIISRNPAIKECTPESIMGSIVGISVLGLNLSLGEAYLIPYNNRQTGNKECQFQISYHGWIKLARQSGEIKSIYGYVVRERDTFDYELGLESFLKHKPMADTENAGKVTYAYAVAHFKHGGHAFMVITASDIEKLRLRSPMQKLGEMSGAWKTDFEEMCVAKAVKKLKKWLPKSDTLEMASKSEEKTIDIRNIQDGSIKVEEIEEPEYTIEDTKQEEKSEAK